MPSNRIQPASSGTAGLEIGHQVKHSLHHKEDRQRKGEGGDSDERMQQKINADDQVQNRDQNLPDNVPDAMRLEGMDELKCAAKDDEPRYDEDHAPRRSEWECDRQETKHD